MIYIDLFLGFLKVGLFSFGGAYAAIPLIRDVVLYYGWIDDEKLSYMIAVSESTPGPLMVNMATYIGSTMAGLPGAVIATFTVVLPAFIIIVLILAVMKNLMDNPYVQAVLNGLKPCIMGIILAMGVNMILHSTVISGTAESLSLNGDTRAILLCFIFVIVYFGSRKAVKKGISAITLIGISAIAGIIVYGV
jgi:chromate transporter